MHERLIVRTFFILMVLLVAILTIHYQDLYFGPPLFEVEEYAQNALLITESKSFRNLYGNFSPRWGFNHLGPAFFYCYAFGELLFHDLLPVFSSPQQAHLFAGLVVQSFFWALALTVLMQRARSRLFPWLFVLVAVALLQYLAPDSLLADIWPPYVLAAPLFALIVCAAAVSLGDRSSLPFVVICSGFLLHGHVAQPLFVLPLFALALLGYFKERDREAPAASGSRAGTAAATLAALFALPLVLDMIKGPDSNVALILRHIQAHRGETKGLAQSVGYFLNFLFYKVDAGDRFFDYENLSLSGLVGRNLLPLLLWTAATVVPTALLFRAARPEHTPAQDLRYFRRLAVVSGLAIALTILWGVVQDGKMYAFNGYLNYALLLVALVPLVLLLATALERAAPSVVRATQAGIGILIVLSALTPAAPIDAQRGSNPLVHERARNALERSGRRPVFLDISEWNKSCGIALVLQREGIPFFVPPKAGNMFGRRHATAVSPYDLQRSDLRVWVIDVQGNITIIE